MDGRLTASGLGLDLEGVKGAGQHRVVPEGGRQLGDAASERAPSLMVAYSPRR